MSSASAVPAKGNTEDAIDATAGENAEDCPKPVKPVILCEVCEMQGRYAIGKYKCPACERRTCSVLCVNAHKVHWECTGKRPRAEHVAPMRAFTDHTLTRDYGFLEECDWAVDRANRELRHSEENKLTQSSKRCFRQRIELARACVEPERRMQLSLAPEGMALARSNTTKVCGGAAKNRKGFIKNKGKGKGKGKDKGKGKGKDIGKNDDGVGDKPVYIAWHVEWHFGVSGPVLVDKMVPEYEILGTVLVRFLNNTRAAGATRHQLLPFVEAGLDQLDVFLAQPARVALAPPTSAPTEEYSEDSGEDEEGNAKRMPPRPRPFIPFDKNRSLKDNLAGQSIVEFPVIHVALPEERKHFSTTATS